MRMRICGGKAAVCLLGVALLGGGSAYAQRGGGRGAPGGEGGFPGGRDTVQPRGQQPGGPQMGPEAGSRQGGLGQPRMGGVTLGGPGGLQLGPAGRWWDDQHYVRALKIRPDQQRRMDAVFDNNRGMLQQSLVSLQQEQTRLAALERAPQTDEQAVFAQIDRVSAARTALEKADAHVRLQLRKEMDAGQISQLEKTPQ